MTSDLDKTSPNLSLAGRAMRKAGRLARYARMARDYQRERRHDTLPRPVFIVCQNRSGSTFLNQLFSEHPQCWTYREGSHQEAMFHEDCPHWLSGRPFLTRWTTCTCPWPQRYQTRVWVAHLARGHRFGVFKIPHALTKVPELSRIVPDVQFVLIHRHPAAQIASAVATGNPAMNLAVTADALIRFLRQQPHDDPRLKMLRYEDLIADPVNRFGRLCEELGMESTPEMIRSCVKSVGVLPGRGPRCSDVPPEMQSRAEELCQLLGYEL